MYTYLSRNGVSIPQLEALCVLESPTTQMNTEVPNTIPILAIVFFNGSFPSRILAIWSFMNVTIFGYLGSDVYRAPGPTSPIAVRIQNQEPSSLDSNTPLV